VSGRSSIQLPTYLWDRSSVASRAVWKSTPNARAIAVTLTGVLRAPGCCEPQVAIRDSSPLDEATGLRYA